MNGRKLFLNIFAFSILIVGFLYFYINSNNIAKAGELRLCVKGASMSSLDFTQYLTIEYPEYSCPTGYIMMPAGFNLNLLQYPTSTNILGSGNNPNGNSSTSSTTLPGQNNPNPADNPYSDLYNDLTNSGNNGSGNNNGYNPSNGGNNQNSGNGNNNWDDNLSGQLGNLNGGSNFGDSSFNNGNLNGGSNFGDSSFNNGNLNGGSNFGNESFGNQNGNNGANNPYQVNPNPIIQVNEALANGRFETLDPNDYKYCVLLTRDMMVGATDTNTGREVSALQMYLYDRGYLNISANGNYDQNTALAVAKFQYRNQIEVSGIVKADLRSILKELTCIKYPVISYVAKPISPAPITVKVTTGSSNSNTTPKTTTTTKKPTTSKPTTSKPTTVIPPTTNEKLEIIASSTPTGLLSPIEGNMYLSKGNILYFTYNTKTTKPFICLSLNNTDCTNNANYAPITEGIMMSLYEVVNFSNFWAFSVYNSQIWGAPGDKTRIYLKDNQNAKNFSVYVVNVFN